MEFIEATGLKMV